MKSIKVTEEDVARYLSAKSRSAVYQGFTPLEIFRRELDLSQFWVTAYAAAFAFVVATNMARHHTLLEPLVLLPWPLVWLIKRQKRLEHLLIVHLRGKPVTVE